MRPLSQPATDSDQVLGRLDALIVIVEYGDYDCPHTRKAHANLKQLMSERPGQLALVFRVFPLRHIHANAETLARLMAAVPAQRFWQAHEAMMGVGRMAVPAAHELLSELGLDVPALVAASASVASVASRVQLSLERGQSDGVHSTPSFFFNGAPWDGHYDIDTLRHQLETAPVRGA